MGGSISVTIVEENGTMHKMQRWTNPLSYFVLNQKFLEKDKVHIQDYLDRWLPLKADWEKNGPDGPFEQEGTKDFFPHAGMVPAEYGIVVIDLQKDKIIAVQNYMDFSHIDKLNPDVEDDDENWKERNEFFDYCEQVGRLSDIKFRKKQLFISAKLSLLPFEVHCYDKNVSNMKLVMELLDAEYGLNDEEKKVWFEDIAWLEEYEEESRIRAQEHRNEVWKRKGKLKKLISSYHKPIPFKERLHRDVMDLCSEVAAEVSLGFSLIDFYYLEDAMNKMETAAEENTLYVLDSFLYIETEEEKEKIRCFIQRLPSSSKVFLFGHLSGEITTIKEVMN